MFALRQIIEDPQDVITVPVEFRHRPIEIIFMALESNAPDLPAQNGMTATSKGKGSDPFNSLPISLDQVSIYSQAITLFNQRNVPGSRSPFKNHLGLLQYLRVICTDPRYIGTEASTLEPLASYRKRAPKLHWLINELTRPNSYNKCNTL